MSLHESFSNSALKRTHVRELRGEHGHYKAFSWCCDSLLIVVVQLSKGPGHDDRERDSCHCEQFVNDE